MWLLIGIVYHTDRDHHIRSTWGISSVGRAPALQAGCQEFESPILHSRIGKHSSIAQSVERLTVNQNVPGSSPGGGVRVGVRVVNGGGL